MFWGRNKKNNVYPCKPQFYYIKGGGFRGSKLYRYVLVMCASKTGFGPPTHSPYFSCLPFQGGYSVTVLHCLCASVSNVEFVLLLFVLRISCFWCSGRLSLMNVAFPGYFHLYKYLSYLTDKYKDTDRRF